MSNYSNTLYFETFEVSIYLKSSWLSLPMLDDGCEEFSELEEALKPLDSHADDPWADQEIIEFAMSEISDYLDGEFKDLKYKYHYEDQTNGLISMTVAAII